MSFGLWKFVHLVSMALWLGGMAALGMLAGRARRTGDAKIVAFVYSATGRFYRGMVAAVAVAAVLSGAMLVLITGRGWFRPVPDHWLFQMEVLGPIAMLLTLFYVVPNAGALAKLAERAASGEPSPELARRVKRQVIVGNLVGLMLVYLVLVGAFRF